MAGGEGQQDDRASRGGGEHEQEERTDGWMATYADMVTLLMTFFVLLFAISNIDAQKFALVAAALSRGGLTPERFSEIEVKYGGDMDPFNPNIPTEERAPDPPSTSSPGQVGNPELDALAAMLTAYIDDNGMGDRMVLLFDGEFLLLRVGDVLFRSGSAELTPEMRDVGAQIAHMLARTQNEDNPFEIVIAGHTDNIPINTVNYQSNWELSLDRANNFLRLLIRESGMYSSYFSARGYGEERPIEDNDTSEGRQANRRVEVLISKLRETADMPEWASHGATIP